MVIINLKIKVESRHALRSILVKGAEHSLYDYDILDFKEENKGNK